MYFSFDMSGVIEYIRRSPRETGAELHRSREGERMKKGTRRRAVKLTDRGADFQLDVSTEKSRSGPETKKNDREKIKLDFENEAG